MTFTPPPPDFDRIARAYRWCEYMSLGPLLQQTRTHHLPRLGACRQAYVLGDGDGRFTARLLATNRTIRVDAVDSSASMLHLLRANAARATPDAGQRLVTRQSDALEVLPPAATDLVVTHFFLDCFEQCAIDDLALRIARRVPPGALWLFSDFRIPAGLLHWPARLYVRALYAAFGLLTGLRTTHLPDHAQALGRAGFQSVAQQRKFFGLLTTELWQLQ